MENWQYAAGTQNVYAVGTVWTDQSTPGTFEEARLALDKLIREEGGDDWVIDPCIIKRSDRHPAWVRVHDHAAELLAEALTDIALGFAANGNDIMQGKDLSRVVKRVSFTIGPNKSNEEYGG